MNAVTKSPTVLTSILSRMLNMANSQPMRPISTTLKSGLHIVICREPQRYRLHLSIMDGMPSESQWNTVIKHWPYNLFQVLPKVDMESHTLHGFIRLSEFTRPAPFPESI